MCSKGDHVWLVLIMDSNKGLTKTLGGEIYTFLRKIECGCVLHEQTIAI